MSSKNTNSHFLDSSPSKEFYNDDSEMISLLNNMWGSNYNNLKNNPNATTNNTESVPSRRLTSSALSIAHDHLSKQTPHKAIANSRQPSIPTVPSHHMNPQHHDSHLIFLESPNFDSFITFTPNQIQPSNKLFSNQKQYQHQHHHQHQHSNPHQHQHSHQNAGNGMGKEPSKSQLLSAQYLPIENFVSISPSLRTPLANKSNVEDLFDTPYLNTLYSTFANTTNTDEVGNNNNSNQQLHLQSQHIKEIAFVQTPLTEKLDKIFKTPTSNDIFNSKQFFGNSTIKRLTNTYIPSNTNSAVKINPHGYLVDESNNGTMNRNPSGIVNSNTDKIIETDFANFKNSPCVKHKQYELIQKEKMNMKSNDRVSNPSSNLLATVRESEESSKAVTQNFFQAPMASSENTFNTEVKDETSATDAKMMHMVESTVTTPKKSRRSRIKKKQSTRASKRSSDDDHKIITPNRFGARKGTSIASKSNVDNSMIENEVMIDSSPSTIVVSSASKSSTRLTVVPGNKLLEASPTPMNKYINSVLAAQSNQQQTQLTNTHNISDISNHSHNDISSSTNNILDDGDKNHLHSHHNEILTPNHIHNINSNNNYFVPSVQENPMLAVIPTAPVMGVFKEQSGKSLRKYKTQPLGLGSFSKSSPRTSNKKFGRSTSLNDSINSNSNSNSTGNAKGNNGKGKKRSRGNGGTIHFIMADPDQLKGNKKRRISRKKPDSVSNGNGKKNGDKFVPLRNSTNIVNNRNRSCSPVKEKNVNAVSGSANVNNTNGNENNIFWESR